MGKNRRIWSLPSPVPIVPEKCLTSISKNPALSLWHSRRVFFNVIPRSDSQVLLDEEMYREKTFLFPGMSWFFLFLKEIPTPPMDVMVHNLEQDKRFFKSYSLTSTNVTGLCGILLLVRLLNTTKRKIQENGGGKKWRAWLWYHFKVISNRRLRFAGLNLGNRKTLIKLVLFRRLLAVVLMIQQTDWTMQITGQHFSSFLWENAVRYLAPS